MTEEGSTARNDALDALRNPHLRAFAFGQMAAAIRAIPKTGEAHVVAGWRIGEEGRKRYAGSALWSADGELLARARSTWIVTSTERDPAPEG